MAVSQDRYIIMDSYVLSLGFFFWATIMMANMMVIIMTNMMTMMMMMVMQRTSTVVSRRLTLPKAEKTAFDHSLECRHIADDTDDNDDGALM